MGRVKEQNSLRSVAEAAGMSTTWVKLRRDQGMSDEQIIELGRLHGEKQPDGPKQRQYSRAKDAAPAPPPDPQPQPEPDPDDPIDDGARGSLKDVILRKETSIARLRELEVLEQEGRFVDAEEALGAWATVGNVIRDSMMAIPDRIAQLLASITDHRQVRTILDKEIRAALETLPERIHGSYQKAA